MCREDKSDALGWTVNVAVLLARATFPAIVMNNCQFSPIRKPRTRSAGKLLKVTPGELSLITLGEVSRCKLWLRHGAAIGGEIESPSYLGLVFVYCSPSDSSPEDQSPRLHSPSYLQHHQSLENVHPEPPKFSCAGIDVIYRLKHVRGAATLGGEADNDHATWLSYSSACMLGTKSDLTLKKTLRLSKLPDLQPRSLRVDIADAIHSGTSIQVPLSHVVSSELWTGLGTQPNG